MKIPFAAIKVTKGAPPVVGDTWAFSASRYDYSVYLPKTFFTGTEMSSTSYGLSLWGFHHLERYDYLALSDRMSPAWKRAS